MYRALIPNLTLIGPHQLLYLLRFNKSGIPNPVLVIPKKLRHKALSSVHSHQLSAHWGIRKSLATLNQYFYWPSLTEDTTIFIANCAVCLAKRRPPAGPGPVQTEMEVGQPWTKCYVDLVGPLPTSTSGMRYVLTVQDSFSRFPLARPIPDKSASTVAQALFEELICNHGPPLQLHSDNGSEFTAKLFEEMMNLLEIKHTCTPVYSPRSNRIERFHRTLGEQLRTVVADDQKDWPAHVPLILFAYRTAVHASTQISPFRAIFGREANIPAKFLFGFPADVSNTTIGNYASNLRDNLLTVYDQMRTNLKSSFRRASRLYTGPNRGKDIQPQQLVWYFTPYRRQGRSRKLTNGWTGPWIVKKKISDILFILNPVGNWASTAKAFELPTIIDRIVPYHGSQYPVIEAPKVRVTLRDCIDEVDQELQLADYSLTEDSSYQSPAYSPTRQLVMQVAPPGLTRLLNSELIKPTLKDELVEPLPPMPMPDQGSIVQDVESVSDTVEPVETEMDEAGSLLSAPDSSGRSSFSVPLAGSSKRPLTSSDTESDNLPMEALQKRVKVIYQNDSSSSEIKDHKLVSKCVKTLKRPREPEVETARNEKPAGWWKKFRKKNKED